MSDPSAHLLIVDDDERIRGLLQKFLVRHGFLTTAARDARISFTKRNTVRFFFFLFFPSSDVANASPSFSRITRSKRTEIPLA